MASGASLRRPHVRTRALSEAIVLKKVLVTLLGLSGARGMRPPSLSRWQQHIKVLCFVRVFLQAEPKGRWARGNIY